MFSSQSLGPTPTSSQGQLYFRIRNALALISRCVHFVTSKRVEKERNRERDKEEERETMKFNFLPKVTIPKRIKVDTLTSKGGRKGNRR